MPEGVTISWCHKGDVGFDEGYARVLALRIKIFVEEQGFQNEADDTDYIAHHLLMEREGRLVATARIFPDEGSAWHVGRVAVEQDERGTGTGRQVMTACEEKARALGGGSIVLSAQQRVQPFYEKCGYRAKGEVYFDEFCPHINMEKAL